MKYLAKYGKVWKNRQTSKTSGRELELKHGEKLADYVQVDSAPELVEAPKEKEKPTFDMGGNQ